MTSSFALVQERRTARERLFFVGDASKRVDYVLVYQDVNDSANVTKREYYEENLDNSGLDLEYRDKNVSMVS